MKTEESTSVESPKTTSWFDLSYLAACFIIAGIMVLGISWWTWPPFYVLVIRDVLGYGLLIAGFYLAWKWYKGNFQKPKSD